MDTGPNLARGAQGLAEINSGSLSQRSAELLTDGDPAPRHIPGAMSSTPYQPKVALQGRFGVEFGKQVSLNLVIMHHGTWNGHTILYPPEKMKLQYWDGQRWQDVGHAQTTWLGEHISRTSFDAVTTRRVSAHVERPNGGRLSMREIEAYHVSQNEIQRVEALRKERIVEKWTDYLLMSHVGARAHAYGEFAFDGEMALVRKDARGQISRVLIERGAVLKEQGHTIVASEKLLDALTATWENATIRLDCLAPYGITLLRQEATDIIVGDRALKVSKEGDLLILPPAEGKAPPRISRLRVQRHPAQKGLAGGQPWAVVTWRTDRPATSQVEFGSEGRFDRRTILQAKLVTVHKVRVDFLRPGKGYALKAIAVNEHGLRAEALAE